MKFPVEIFQLRAPVDIENDEDIEKCIEYFKLFKYFTLIEIEKLRNDLKYCDTQVCLVPQDGEMKISVYFARIK